MATLGLEREIIDQSVYDNTVQRFREQGIALPTFAQLADPTTIPDKVKAALEGVDPDAPHPLNLFRVHWYNDADRKQPAAVPGYVVLPPELTGIPSPIVVILGERFPMIRTHKVLAAYGCLAPRIITGQFDPTQHMALWPSTGNYCRGGVAISRIMGCHGVAILPEGMSKERFDWLDEWVVAHEDIVRTPGTESNVKEIYDKCAELDSDPHNIIFNQFSEFGNHLVHYLATGKAVAHAFEDYRRDHPNLRMRAFASATGSAGTIAAGDYLKDVYGALIAASEAVECPTLLENGFGEHNIQGIGDKHVPYIHNAMNTDVVVAISEVATDQLDVLFNTEVGRKYLVERQGVSPELAAHLGSFGLSSICNILTAIKVARHYQWGPDDAIVTVATDAATMYRSEHAKAIETYFGGAFDEVHAGEVFGRHILGAATDNMLELDAVDRRRVFNLGYYTWVEQQGVSISDFVARRDQAYWVRLREWLTDWDEMIGDFNARTGVLEAL
ncbi:MAG: pyridoxal-5'-phosphate-dependent protein subunit beta [Proteobacteria bacterium]|nr:MAG: pyridoxal-5'-phosphate-dependent protein subunit beta [Pseudomonadota bacterium]